jgi:hypothetical protein
MGRRQAWILGLPGLLILALVQTSSAACPLGRFTGTIYGITCNLCPLGTYNDGSSTDCPLCPAGTYGATMGLTTAACSGNCTAGYACREGTISSTPLLFMCPVGKFSVAGAATCSLCPGGTYGATEGVTTSACSGNCTAGYACPAGSTNATAMACPAGKYSAYRSGSCSQCPIGTYGSAPLMNTSACSGNCTAGYHCAAESTSSTAARCPPGRYSLAAGDSCLGCAPGTYSVVSGLPNSTCDGI